MWTAKATAQPKTSRSPSPSPAKPPESSAVPASASSTATIVTGRKGTPMKRWKSGVKTTKSPVMSPALPGLMNCKPSVWTT